VRGRIAVLAGAAAAAVAVVHKLRGRRAPVAAPPAGEPRPDPRAEELRDKLAASREVADERDADEQHETPVDEAIAAEDVDQRRREIHDRGRAAVADMNTEAAPTTEP
jgi:hypothetical protein